MRARDTRLVISGGGPAGLMAGLLFARAGVETLVLEKHEDFLRDFRGDTVHPSTLRLFHELGLLEELLRRPHDRVKRLDAVVGERRMAVADFYRLDPRWAFIAMMPQWEFLDFVAAEARRRPEFELVLGGESESLIEEGGRIAGLRYRTAGEEVEVRSRLVLLADGRSSALREQAGLKRRTIGAPMDVFWFRIPRPPSAENETTGLFRNGRILVLIDRGDYWQCAFVFPKGAADRLRSAGIDRFRNDVAAAAAPFELRTEVITSWEQVKLLTVAIDRLERWHRPGLLAIGDAAHAMSPVGGVGINLAIQDAVAAANLLAAPLAEGAAIDGLLGKVENRRRLPVRIIQTLQAAVQNRIVAPVLSASGESQLAPPLPLRLLDRYRLLRSLPAALLGIGIRPEHVGSPVAVAPPDRRHAPS